MHIEENLENTFKKKNIKSLMVTLAINNINS